MITNEEAQTKIKFYIKIAIYLAILTLIEYGVTFISMSKMLIGTTLVIIACVKAGMVGWYYMHLNHETAWLKWVAVSPLIAAFYAGVLGIEAPTRVNSHYYSAPKRVVVEYHPGEAPAKGHEEDSH